MHSTSSFVGREAELQVLQKAMAAAQAGRGQVVAIEGAAGIGKTALCTQLADLGAQAGFEVLWGRCHEEAGAPVYWPWRQLVRGFAQRADPAELTRLLGRGQAYIASVVPELGECMPLEPGACDTLESAQARFALFDAFAGFWQRAAQRRPLLLVLDDLHWADPTSLRLLAFVALEGSGHALLIVGTWREGERDEQRGATLSELLRCASFQRLALGGLSLGETAQFVGQFGGLPADAQLVRALYERTEGHPLYVQETVRLLAGPTGGEQALHAVPAGVRSVIGRRLAALDAASRRLLERAAVIGREFELELLAAFDERTIDDALLASLQQAVARRLIEPTADAARYRFVHALIRETLYEEMAGAPRALLHRRIGECMESLHAGDTHAVSSLLAHHFAEAAAFGTAAKALDHAQRAAARAMQQLAFEEAARLLERALELQQACEPQGRPLRAELWLKLGEAWFHAGGAGACHRAYGEAAELAIELADVPRLARAALGYADACHLLAVADERAVRLPQQAIEAIGDSDPGLRGELLSMLACVHAYRGELALADAAADAGLRQARRRPQDALRLIKALKPVMHAHYEPGRLAQRLAAGREAHDIAQRSGLLDYDLFGILPFLHVDLLRAGLTGELKTIVAQASVESERRGHPFAHSQALHMQTLMAINEGRFADAEVLALRAYECGRRSDAQRASGAYGMHMFSIRRQQGRLREVLPALRAFVQTAPPTAVWRPGLMVLYAELGMLDECRRECERILARRVEALPAGANPWTIAAFAAEACAALEDRDGADYLYGLLLPQQGSVFIADTAGPCLGAVDRLLGRLATVSGRWDDAERHFETARAIDEGCGSRVWLAHGRYGQAAMHVRRGRRGDEAAARALLAQVTSECAELGMAALAERVAALLDSLGAAPPAPYPCGLSSREVEVLRLLAIGRSNREVAQVLAISPNTVANHIRSILDKTFTANRTEAAAFARHNGLLDA